MTTPRRLTTAIAALTLTAGLAACGSSAEPAGAPTSTSSGAYPLTVQNCGAKVSFDAAPERVVLLKGSPVSYLHELGVMDRVTARAGVFPDEYYDGATRAELKDVQLLTDKLDTSGHLQISKEVVIAEEPDLVLGEVDNLSRETLGSVGIPLIEEPALCKSGGDTDPSFDDIYAQMALYGKVFGREDAATAATDRLRKRVDTITAKVAAAGSAKKRTAAVLYPTVGGGTTYAYGSASMAQPQLEAAGLTNVFADVDERVFEVTLEELLGRNPDVLVVLHSDGAPEPVVRAITDLPGADRLTAVANDDVLPQLFNFTEPASPLAIDGLEKIVERFGS